MPSVLTDIGRAFIASEVAAGRAVDIASVKVAHMIFADPNIPPAPSASLTDVEAAPEYTTAVAGVGKIDPDKVAYSLYLDTTVGDFTITQVGYFADDGAGGWVLVMISNIPPVHKRKNDVAQTGNNYKHTDILQIQGAAQATAITVPAATWQQDLTVLFDAKEDKAAKSIPGGYAALDSEGHVPPEQGGLPTGALTPYCGALAPSGWLLCDGAAVSRSTYAPLFAVLGENFGAGDGATTFNLPDLRGRIPLGLDNLGGMAAGRSTDGWASQLGGAGGAESHLLDLNEVPGHTHAPGTYGADANGAHSHSASPRSVLSPKMRGSNVKNRSVFAGVAVTS